MRRIVVTGIVLIGIVILSSLAATRAPETSVVVAAPSQNSQPVTVTNFPSVQGVSGTVNIGNLPAVQRVVVGNLPAVQQVGGSVAVTNLPGIQSVTGNVAVSNLPAVQMVGGSVAVSNLPLDADGSVRVAPAAPAAPSFLFVKVAEAVPLGVLQATPTASLSVAGWKTVNILFRVNFPPGTGSASCLVPTVYYGAEDLFAHVADGQGVCPGATLPTSLSNFPVLGPEIRVGVGGGSGPSATTLDIWLYLTN